MQHEPLRGFSLFLVSLALGAAAFMQVLDTSIANVSIPYIAGDLGVSSNIGSWVITMFAVGNAISLPLTGWVATRYGSIKVIVFSIALFTFFSWLCAAAFSFNMLILSRFFQGLVAGPLIPLSQSIIVSCYPKEKANFALGIFYVVIVVAPVCGPILGGWLTQDYAWPWIFYINIPVGILATLVAWKYLHKRETPTVKRKVDLVGLILLFFGISLLQILLDKGEQYDWFRSPLICTLAIISGICLIFLVIWEWYEEHPIMELKLLKQAQFRLGTFLMAVSYMIVFSAIVITPLWLQEFMNYTAFWAGVAVAPMGLLPMFLSIPLSKLMNSISPQYFTLSFYLCLTGVFFLFSYMTAQVDLRTIMLTRTLLGFALVQFFSPLTAFTHQQIPPEKMPSATGLFHFFRIFSGGAGTSLAIYLWDRRAILHYQRIGEFLTPFSNKTKGAFSTLHEGGLNSAASLEVLNDNLTMQAYVLATNDLFRLSAWISLALIPFIALSFYKKRKERINSISYPTH